MAAKLIKNAKEYLGTNADRIAMPTTDITVGSSFYETDTKNFFIYDGTIWMAM